jgi:hypothetical protein
LANALDAAMRDAQAAENTVADAAPGGVLSEPEALAVWQRAAQLQAQAAHRMERTPALQAPTANEQSSRESGSYRVRDVEAAAVEAGAWQPVEMPFAAMPAHFGYCLKPAAEVRETG